MHPAPHAELRVEGKAAYLEGDLTLGQASRLLAEGKAAIEAGVGRFDLSGVGQMDSSAISLLLGLRRFAEAKGQGIEIQSLSESLLSLAKLYGVSELL
jgi:phospholipid transport system transporter-binding protein